MSETRMTESRVLLDMSLPADCEGDIAVYEPGPDMEIRVPEVCLSYADFEALGSPEQITVTIEPGDLLNIEEVSLADLPDETLIRATGLYLDGGTFTDCWARPVPAHISGATNNAERLWEVLVFGSTAFGAVTTPDRIASHVVLHTEATR